MHGKADDGKKHMTASKAAALLKKNQDHDKVKDTGEELIRPNHNDKFKD